MRPFTSKASAVSLPPLPLRLLLAGATVARWELHPLKNHALARRTAMMDCFWRINPAWPQRGVAPTRGPHQRRVPQRRDYEPSERTVDVAFGLCGGTIRRAANPARRIRGGLGALGAGALRAGGPPPAMPAFRAVATAPDGASVPTRVRPNPAPSSAPRRVGSHSPLGASRTALSRATSSRSCGRPA
jgi:hypothetical protein